jgi:hypothetical protein
VLPAGDYIDSTVVILAGLVLPPPRQRLRWHIVIEDHEQIEIAVRIRYAWA